MIPFILLGSQKLIPTGKSLLVVTIIVVSAFAPKRFTINNFKELLNLSLGRE
jgi:hypothetical protein